VTFSVFQSTRPRGARLTRPSIAGAGSPGFNPRARVGRDNVVSIFFPPSLSFNPRARVGRDWPRPAAVRFSIEFQSTRPRGARLLFFIIC